MSHLQRGNLKHDTYEKRTSRTNGKSEKGDPEKDKSGNR